MFPRDPVSSDTDVILTTLLHFVPLLQLREVAEVGRSSTLSWREWSCFFRRWFCPLLRYHSNTSAVAAVVDTPCWLFVLVFFCLKSERAAENIKKESWVLGWGFVSPCWQQGSIRITCTLSSACFTFSCRKTRFFKISNPFFVTFQGRVQTRLRHFRGGREERCAHTSRFSHARHRLQQEGKCSEAKNLRLASLSASGLVSSIWGTNSIETNKIFDVFEWLCIVSQKNTMKVLNAAAELLIKLRSNLFLKYGGK